MLRTLIRKSLLRMGYELKQADQVQYAIAEQLPDKELYTPLYSPWQDRGELGRLLAYATPKSLVTPAGCYALTTLLQQALLVEGDVWECGVYKGGTAAMMAALLKEKNSPKKLHLFDTFEGMPQTDAARDWHKAGDFGDTDVESVRKYVDAEEIAVIHKGFIPDTFAGLENSTIAFAHIDLDIYKSILDSLHFIWPRLSVGGVVVFDDYGYASCRGARLAVDEFFAQQKAFPLCLQTGQAIVFKSVA